jgi:hypothetical protein
VSRPDPAVAIAVLRPGSGIPITGSSRITAEHLADYLPDPAVAREVGDGLRAAGFTVGPLVGIGMSITGPAELFEHFFATSLQPAPDGSLFALDEAGEPSRELPLAAVPDALRRGLHAVSFEPPAEAVTTAGDAGWP